MGLLFKRDLRIPFAVLLAQSVVTVGFGIAKVSTNANVL